MAKTYRDKKIVHVKPYVRKTDNGKVKVSLTDAAKASGKTDCSAEVNLPSFGFRVGGGPTIPLARVLQLNPFVGLSLLSGAKGRLAGSCGEPQDIPAGNWYGFFQAGIGGEFLL